MPDPFFVPLVERADCTTCHGTGADPVFDGVCAMCKPPSGRHTRKPSKEADMAARKASKANFWDDEEIVEAATSGSYVKFTNEGDEKVGVVAALGKRTFDEGKATSPTPLSKSERNALRCSSVIFCTRS